MPEQDWKTIENRKTELLSEVVRVFGSEEMLVLKTVLEAEHEHRHLHRAPAQKIVKKLLTTLDRAVK